ncbi:[protein-PII] uridylyltransferase [Hydrogenovibrio kuenenii]|uniref:[protein-PII] uridylyltransferase n=1 Tax=Hydrogenovibrio kuenenii TaxID=63658 RepID=UPI0004673705|nr:[protein-PII] uridylyltransferase [Hydrogenovibrio kuenenii]
MSDTPVLPNFISSLQHDERKVSLQNGRLLLEQFNQQQFEKFDNNSSIESLLKERTSFVDQLIIKIWHHFLSKEEQENISLVAVGGYGRQELQPYSDIDLLILGDNCTQFKDPISDFITYLWDLGFQVGHSVRSIAECIADAKEDLSTATSLIESRWLAGDYEISQKLQKIWLNKTFWPSIQFFEAKLEEQQVRHKRFQDTFYQLEPNVKESPGGLRDLQTIFWIAKRHFGAHSFQGLLEHDFISLREFQEIQKAYWYLNKIRFGLHRLKKRHEDRLLFEYQQQLAELFGFHDDDTNKMVESFMKPYYQNVSAVARLNEILIQHFKEEIFKPEQESIEHINPRFQMINNYLDVKHDDLFEKNPTALLEIFIILENYKQSIQGIRSRTIRLIRNNLHLINKEFRSDPINKALFIEIFRQPKGVNASLKRMHAYGILGAYLPVFQKISGLMQFNIFHAYTVDEHTLLVIRNIRRFFVDDHAYEFPTAHQIAKNICKPEILLLAGLFHDIAKGRDGAHEELGAIDAKNFSFRHNLSENDSTLLSWLVLKHLEFSYIAQKKDLSDPQVITQFAKTVDNQERLDYLYLLTLADVLATSQDVWNDWKNQLFLQLYHRTTQALDNSSALPRDKTKQAILNKERARELLKKREIHTSDYQEFWAAFDKTELFNQQTTAEISRITKQLYNADKQNILINLEGKTQRGATELILYMPDRNYLFAQITNIIDKLGLNIVEAKIYSGSNGQTLVIIYLLDRENNCIDDKEKLYQITETLHYELSLSSPSPQSQQPQPRRIRVFETPTEIKFNEVSDQFTELTIHTKDIPGLLARIGLAFKQCEIRVHGARINTVGEKAEDVFLISSAHQISLKQDDLKEKLTATLLEYIE